VAIQVASENSRRNEYHIPLAHVAKLKILGGARRMACSPIGTVVGGGRQALCLAAFGFHLAKTLRRSSHASSALKLFDFQ